MKIGSIRIHRTQKYMRRPSVPTGNFSKRMKKRSEPATAIEGFDLTKKPITSL